MVSIRRTYENSLNRSHVCVFFLFVSQSDLKRKYLKTKAFFQKEESVCELIFSETVFLFILLTSCAAFNSGF